jgi:hypothetical protein
VSLVHWIRIISVLTCPIISGASLDINVAATFVRYSDYLSLISLIDSSETIHSGLRTVSLLIGADIPSGGWLS